MSLGMLFRQDLELIETTKIRATMPRCWSNVRETAEKTERSIMLVISSTIRTKFQYPWKSYNRVKSANKFVNASTIYVKSLSLLILC